MKNALPTYRLGFLFSALVIALLTVPHIGQAQIAPLSDQYLINPFQSNPAIAGTERYMPLTLSSRQQWIGLNKAPSTQSISIHRRIRAKGIRFTPNGFINKGKNSFGRIGIGGSVFNYTYGAVSHTGVNLVYAYHIFVGQGRLAFGLAPSFFQYSLNKTGFILPDGSSTDPLVANSPSESLSFIDVNAGMHYYSKNNYAGLSIIQLLNSTVQFGDLSFDSQDPMSQNPDLSRTMYVYYGQFLNINRDLLLEPSVWVKFNDQTGVRFDGNLVFHLQDAFQAGLAYRFKESFGIIAGLKLDNLRIRYLFEAPLTSQVPTRYTSHQILVTFNLGEPID